MPNSNMLRVVEFGGINHQCFADGCTQDADWLARDKTGAVVAAACKEHKAEIRAIAIEFARHQLADPHCTCNDCIEAFSRQ